ncbi:hypothetical protein ACF0H5_009798 [Mactra antiquata]
MNSTLRGVFILLLLLHQCEAGFLCSKKKMTWIDAINSCFSHNGRPVKINQDNEAMIQHMLENRLSIWTSEYSSSFCNNQTQITRCGYRYDYINATNWRKGEVHFGNCNITRNIICEWSNMEGKLTYTKTKRSYDVVLTECQPNAARIDVSRSELTSDYYWVPDSKKTFCLYDIPEYIDNGISSEAICGVYDYTESSFYVNCSSSRHMLCEFDNLNTSYDGCKPCVTDQSLQPTTTSITKHTDKLRTSKKPLTAETTSPTDKAQSSTTHKDITHSDHASDVTQVPTTISEAFNDVTQLSTDSNEEQTSANYEERKNDQGGSDLGLYIGAPVAVLVTILVVIVIIMIVRYRRRCGNIHSVNNRANDSTLYSKPEDDEHIYIDAEGGESNTGDHSCSMDISLHDRTDCDHYNTTAGRTCPPSISTNNYDVMDRTVNDDVYDTTRSMKPVHKTTDNIYNKLNQFGDIEKIYDKTSQQQQKRSIINDDTYNTLN